MNILISHFFVANRISSTRNNIETNRNCNMHFIYIFKVTDNGIIFYEHLTINIMLSFDDLTILQFAFNATAVFYNASLILKKRH